MGVDDGRAGTRPVCDPLPGRDGDLLERCAAHAGGNALLPGQGDFQEIPIKIRPLKPITAGFFQGVT